MQTGKIQQSITDSFIEPKLRITIPYKVRYDFRPNCLKCHTNAKDGDILGSISMEFDLSKSRSQAIETVLNIMVITIVFASFISIHSR